MRIATFNLLSGRAMGEEQADPDLLVKATAELDADVLALQEVDRHQPRSGGIDQTALVAESMRAPHWRFVPALVGTPGVRSPAGGPEWRAAERSDEEVDGVGSHVPAAYGIALISRYPVLRWQVLRLRPVPVMTPVIVETESGRRKLIVVRDEPRTSVVAVIDAPSGPLTVATTHLSFIPGWNTSQLRRLVSALVDLPRTQILLGDLNLARLPRFVTREWRSLVQERTWPAGAPRLQLDHVLGRGDLPDVRAVSAPQLPLSDHRALVVDFA